MCSSADLNADGHPDSISMVRDKGRTSSEDFLRVTDGSSGAVYRAVKIAYANNFFSIIPFAATDTGTPFFPHFYQVAVDSLCKGIPAAERPEEGLAWLLERYNSGPGDSLVPFELRWFEGEPGFSLYFTCISTREYPRLLEGCPPHLLESSSNAKEVRDLFDTVGFYIVVYYGHNHRRPGMEDDYVAPLVAVHGDTALRKTAHGVLLQHGALISWVYISDNEGRLRHASIGNVLFDEAVLRVFRESNYGGSVVEVDLENKRWSVTDRTVH